MESAESTIIFFFNYNTSTFSTVPYSASSLASFCLMISTGFAAIQAVFKNSTQTIFFWTKK